MEEMLQTIIAVMSLIMIITGSIAVQLYMKIYNENKEKEKEKEQKKIEENIIKIIKNYKGE